MVGSRIETEIVRLFTDVTKSYSILQISKLLHTSYPHVHKKVKELEKQDVLRLVSVGPSHLCQLNLESDLAKNLLCLARIDERDVFLARSQLHGRFLNSLKNLKSAPGFDFAFVLGKKIYLVSSGDVASLRHACLSQKVLCNCLSIADFPALLKTTSQDSIVLLLGFERYYELLEIISKSQDRGLLIR